MLSFTFELSSRNIVPIQLLLSFIILVIKYDNQKIGCCCCHCQCFVDAPILVPLAAAVVVAAAVAVIIVHNSAFVTMKITKVAVVNVL